MPQRVQHPADESDVPSDAATSPPDASPPPAAPDSVDVAFTPSEIDQLRAELDSWPKKSREEKANLKATLITNFLKERKVDHTNPWARGYFVGVSSVSIPWHWSVPCEGVAEL